VYSKSRMASSDDTALIEVRALVQRSEAVREDELRRLLARCPQLTGRERTRIAAMSVALVRQLLNGAIAKLSDKAEVDCAQAQRDAHALSELFDVRTLELDGTAVAMRSSE